MFYKTESFPEKIKKLDDESKRELSDVQSGLNRWLYSLKKSNDLSRKHYQAMKTTNDPDRVLWVQINEPKLSKMVKIKTKQSKYI